MSAPYLPTFNLGMEVWYPGNTPAIGPRDYATLAQLYYPTKGQLDLTPGLPFEWVPPLYIRIPYSTYTVYPLPIIGQIYGYNDVAGNQWYFKVRWWSHAHEGFDNMYIQLLVETCNNDGTTPATNR